MADKFVELFEGAFVEQQINAFSRAKLALLVLAFPALGPSASFGFGVEFTELFNAVAMFAVVQSPRARRLNAK